MTRIIKAATIADAMKQIAAHEATAANAIVALDTAVTRLRSLLDVYRVAEETQRLSMTRTSGADYAQHQVAHHIYRGIVMDLERDVMHLMDAQQKTVAALGGAGNGL